MRTPWKNIPTCLAVNVFFRVKHVTFVYSMKQDVTSYHEKFFVSGFWPCNSSLLVTEKPWAMLGKNPKFSITILSQRDGNFQVASQRTATQKLPLSRDNIVIEKFRIDFLAWRKVVNDQQYALPVKPRYCHSFWFICQPLCWKENWNCNLKEIVAILLLFTS